MNGYNKIILIGNLTRDPEMRSTTASELCKFGLAVNRKIKDREEVCFIDIIVWGKQAENCAKYLSKGSAVLVDGRLNLNTWETQDGQKRSMHEVIAEKVQFLSQKNTEPEPRQAQRDTSSFVVGEGDIPF